MVDVTVRGFDTCDGDKLDIGERGAESVSEGTILYETGIQLHKKVNKATAKCFTLVEMCSSFDHTYKKNIRAGNTHVHTTSPFG